MTITPRSLTPLLLASALLAACNVMPNKGSMSIDVPLAPTKGNTATGQVRFTEFDGGVIVEASLSGLAPGGHGFHVHEKGDCSAPDATSAGGHFNPTGMPHGAPDKAEHHLGDLPMLVADAAGNARLNTTIEGLSLGATSKASILGRAVIVHAAPDDFATQPTGNSGARVACGVIAAK